MKRIKCNGYRKEVIFFFFFLHFCNFKRVGRAEKSAETTASQVLEMSKVPDAIESVFSALRYCPFDFHHASGPKP